MNPTKPGKGILASLEHRTAEPPRGAVGPAPTPARGAPLVVAGGVLAGALLVWWLCSGPSPVLVHDALPAAAQAAPAWPPTGADEAAAQAAAIVDEAPPQGLVPPTVATPAPAVVPVPIARAVMRHDRVAVAHGQARPAAKRKQERKQVVAVHRQPRRALIQVSPAVPDTDVALLSALVAHANEHDVVEPRSGDSTAGLLQRCRRVGGEEGRLCRLRICAGRSRDDGCRVE